MSTQRAGSYVASTDTPHLASLVTVTSTQTKQIHKIASGHAAPRRSDHLRGDPGIYRRAGVPSNPWRVHARTNRGLEEDHGRGPRQGTCFFLRNAKKIELPFQLCWSRKRGCSAKRA